MDADPSWRLYLVRHGETEWARLGRHTGRTDVVLTDEGRDQARALGERLAGRRFARVLSSPLARALETARLARIGADVEVEVDDDLAEWDYGEYEGLTTPQIRAVVPGWTIWTEGPMGGETAADVALRADRVIDRASGAAGDVALFAHGHLLRVLAARWLGLPPDEGRRFALSTGTLSVLGWERETRVLELWNEGAVLQ